jgi:hypothetical protein
LSALPLNVREGLVLIANSGFCDEIKKLKSGEQINRGTNYSNAGDPIRWRELTIIGRFSP